MTETKRKGGCLGRMVRGAVALVLLAVIVGVGVSILGGDADTYTLHGEVLIMEDANFTVSGDSCAGVGAFAGVEDGATMIVTDDGGDQHEATLDAGRLSPEGNCQLSFTVDVPESDRYAFDVAALSQVKEATTIGEDEDGTRWVSVQYD